MRRILMISIIFFIFQGKNGVLAQTILVENFTTVEKGYWIDESGTLVSDFSGVEWSLDISNAAFAASGDYAKTVSTSGGRFETLDSDGDVIWLSPEIAIDDYSSVNVRVRTSETGSNTGIDKKYVKARYRLDGKTFSFSPDSVVWGNWGEKTLTTNGLQGERLQLLIVMNSSYSNDKVIVDDIVIEGIDSTQFQPEKVVIGQLPSFAFAGEETLIKASVVNKRGETITDRQFDLSFRSSDMEVEPFTYDKGFYYWKVRPIAKGNSRFEIIVQGETVEGVVGNIAVYLKEEVVLSDDFEDGNLDGWRLGDHWEISGEGAIDGNYSMKHLKQEANGSSSIITDVGNLNLGNGNYRFSFTFKNGNWDPSSSNLFYLKLFYQTIGDYLPDGYAVGVNAKGSSDLVSLWTVKDDVIEELIAETSCDWGENDQIQIDLLRSPDGHWELITTNTTKGTRTAASGINAQSTTINCIGVTFSYTQTRSGQLWFDDLYVLRENTPPSIKEVSTFPNGNILVCFTEPISPSTFEKNDIELKTAQGIPIEIVSYGFRGADSLELVCNKIEDPELLLSISHFTDQEGAQASVKDFAFNYRFPTMVKDVVFTEIMADPSPAIGLPETEYIEVFNRSNHSIDLHNWIIQVKEQRYPLPAYLLKAGEYCVICPPNDSSMLTVAGIVVFWDRFPTLLNSGSYIALLSPEEEVIDALSYSDHWYGDTMKKNGGWSLEKIDLNRFCGDGSNWSSSIDPMGGTPARANSIDRPNGDTLAPSIVEWELVSTSEIQLTFSEVPELSSVYTPDHYTIEGATTIYSVFGEEEIVYVRLSQALISGNRYELTIAGIADECSNTMLPYTIPIALEVIEPSEVVINEVLFNPRSGGSDFVELYNRSGRTIELSKLKLATRNDTLGLKSVYPLSTVKFDFEDQSYIVVTKDSQNLVSTYNVPFPDRIVEMKSFPAYPDESGRVVLLNDSLDVIDEFSYSEEMHDRWLSNVEGVSLERISVEDETNDVNNWHSASTVVGFASPGYENSQKEDPIPEDVTMLLNPDAISPNSDGYNDEMIIRFHLDKPGYLANVFIYDSNGRMVNRLVNNSLMGTDDAITFKGENGNGLLLPTGIYIVLTELVHRDGEKKVFKKAFLMTDKR